MHNKILRRLVSLIWVATAVVSTLAQAAQTPTAAQIQMFKNLSPAQQQAMANKYGITLPDTMKQGATEQMEETQPLINERPDKNADPIDEQKQNIAEDAGKLKRFGIDLFAGSPTTFAPTSDAPIPSDYRVGPGDEVVIQLFGKDNETHRLMVNRNGEINFPTLGPIQVSGLSFSEVRNTLNRRISEQKIGVNSDITLGKMRTMQVFIMGDAYKPGAYTVSALTTISQAIYYSGGFSETGALRDIQLKRNGKVVSRLDMYELLLKGDTRNDVRLMPGDVVLIGSVKETVTIDGEINRPAIYEIKPHQSFSSLIAIAGGFTANAHTQQVQVKRYTNQNSRQVLTLNLNNSVQSKQQVKNGDEIYIEQRSDALSDYVEIKGDVKHPGFVQWKQGMRIADLFPSLDYAFNPSADIDYAILVREINPQHDIEVYQLSLADAILAPQSEDNYLLSARDQLIVFNHLLNENEKIKRDETELQSRTLEQAKEKALNDELAQESLISYDTKTEKDNEEEPDYSRKALLAPILLKLQSQSRLGLAPQVAEITGAVKYPGRYPMIENMRTSQLIQAAGGLTYTAYSSSAELASKVINPLDERVSIQIRTIDLKNAILGKANSDIQLNAQDKINVFEKPNANIESTIVLEGEVRFPGTYTVYKGETLGDVLKRAGGPTQYAHLQGAVFTREALRLQEQKLLNEYAADIRQEVAKKSLSADASSVSDPTSTLNMIENASKSKALGRMVVQLEQIANNDHSVDFIVEDGDFLFIPEFRNTVSIMGEVQVPITYLLDDSLDIDDYLNKAGGAKKRADEDRIYVVRADGSVYKPNSGYWFGGNSEDLKPGDTIIVPIDTNYRDSLSVWQAATQILYQTGVAINALDFD